MKFYAEFLILGTTLCFAVNAEPLTLGCSSLVGCKYRPENVIQLLACGQAAKLEGMHIDNLFKCQQHLDETLCKREKTEDGSSCSWISYDEAPFNPGVCLLAKMVPPFAILAKLAITNIVTELKKLNLQVQNIPNMKQTSECQKHSYNRAACIKAKDDMDRPCGWCSGINAPPYLDRYLFNPPSDSMCIHQHLIDWGACELLKKGPVVPCSGSNTTSTTTTTTTTTSTTTTTTTMTGLMTKTLLRPITSDFAVPIVNISFALSLLCAYTQLLL